MLLDFKSILDNRSNRNISATHSQRRGDWGAALAQGAAALRVVTFSMVTEGGGIMDLAVEAKEVPVALGLIASRM